MHSRKRPPIAITVLAMAAVAIPLLMVSRWHPQWREWITMLLGMWVGDDIANAFYRRWKRRDSDSGEFEEARDSKTN